MKSKTSHRCSLNAFAGFVAVGLFLWGMTYVTCQRSTASTSSHSPKTKTHGTQEECSTDFFCSAASKLKKYKASLLADHLGSFRAFTKEDWAKFHPPIQCPSSRPLTMYGVGDGGKLLCKVDGTNIGKGGNCIIYSLGSNGDFQFEQAMLHSTPCLIHTFDCTYDGRSLDSARHFYHKWCIGNGIGQYRTWRNITSALRHDRVDVLKMDVEGFEYEVLSSFNPDDNLPHEIALEFHVNVTTWSKAKAPETPAELAFAFMHMANLGYAAYSQEVNVQVPHCCSEFTFMRVGGMPDKG